MARACRRGDLTTTSINDQERTESRLVELGAHHIDNGQSAEEDHVVLADPEGNEFCVIGPDNKFLAGCGRLGAIGFDLVYCFTSRPSTVAVIGEFAAM